LEKNKRRNVAYANAVALFDAGTLHRTACVESTATGVSIQSICDDNRKQQSDVILNVLHQPVNVVPE
jgi:hypothetical protein